MSQTKRKKPTNRQRDGAITHLIERCNTLEYKLAELHQHFTGYVAFMNNGDDFSNWISERIADNFDYFSITYLFGIPGIN